MANAPGIDRLLAALTSALRLREAPQEEATSAVTSLAASLNPPPSPTRTGVLDAALSLMCFTAPEVWSWNVRFLLEAITTALASSVSCKVVWWELEDKELKEDLVVGGLLSIGDCDKLVATLLDALQSLENCGSSHVLFETIMKVVISASSCRSLLPQSSSFVKAGEKLGGTRKLLGSKLNTCLRMATYSDNKGVPLRLFIWYLDSLIFKADILEILQEYNSRPFLHLKTELHERMSWRSIVRCLAASPVMFLEMKTLLHNWFLMTGLMSILDLQNALVWSILDVLSRPMWWDFSMDVGLRLPFPHSYFPSKDKELMRILNGSVSLKSFLDLVHHIQWKVYDKGNHHSTGTEQQREEVECSVSSNSTWAMLMNFPQWIYFAIMLCFCKKGGMSLALESFLSQALKRELDLDPEIHHAATFYLSAILSLFDQIHLSELHSQMSKLSSPCPVQNATYHASSQRHSQPEKKMFLVHSKKLRKPRPLTVDKSGVSNGICNSTDIARWLQQFMEIFTNLFKVAVDRTCMETEGKNLSVKAPCHLLSKIPLGILMSNPNILDEEGCCLLLHYAGTGAILQVGEVQTAEKASSGSSKNLEEGVVDAAEGTKWLHGASGVFNMFEAIEDMTSTLFDTEDSQRSYICQLKSKSVKYLVKCATKISEGQVSKDNGKDLVMLTDLFNRLLRWKEQGQEHLDGFTSLGDVLEKLSTKISTTEIDL